MVGCLYSRTRIRTPLPRKWKTPLKPWCIGRFALVSDHLYRFIWEVSDIRVMISIQCKIHWHPCGHGRAHLRCWLPRTSNCHIIMYTLHYNSMSQVNSLNWTFHFQTIWANYENLLWEVLARSDEVLSRFVNWTFLCPFLNKQCPLVLPFPTGHTSLGGTAGIGSQPQCCAG